MVKQFLYLNLERRSHLLVTHTMCIKGGLLLLQIYIFLKCLKREEIKNKAATEVKFHISHFARFQRISPFKNIAPLYRLTRA